MIKNPEKVEALERVYLKSSGVNNYQRSLEIFTSLWKEAMALGIIPPKDLLEGIEVDIRIAKILNSCLKNS